MALKDDLARVLDLQPDYKSNHSPETTARNAIVTRDIPTKLMRLLRTASFPVPDQHLHVYGSGAAGLNAKIPWVFIGDSRRTTSAQSGWYLVLLFQQDGRGFYASLNKNSTTSPPDQWDAVPITEESADRTRLRARKLLEDDMAACAGDLVDKINLATNSSIGKAYETTHVTGFSYGVNDLPDDDRLVDDLCTLGDMLVKVYEWDEGGMTNNVEPMHLLLKWSRAGNLHHIDEVEEHRKAAELSGSVTWDCYTESDKSISGVRLEALQKQIESGVPTVALLRESGRPKSDPNLWQASVLGVSDTADALDSLLPPHYEGDSHFLFLALANFVRVEESILSDFVLHASGSPLDEGSMGNQTSPLYIKRVAGAPVVPTPLPQSDAEDLSELSRLTLIEEKVLSELLTELEERLVVLAGPPGTGKTWTARHIADHVTSGDKARVNLIQFHPAMSYESFVQGLQPVSDSRGQINFKVVDGIAVTSAYAAWDDPDKRPHILLIDEINRANLPKVLGELIYLLEYRGEEHGVKLQYQRSVETFALPENLRFIATMNTADRSIRSVDAAIRRRFSVFELSPNPEVLQRYYDSPDNRCEFKGLIAGFETLNAQLEADIDRHHTVGHTFFMRSVLTRERMRTIWRRQILPLLDEYFFDASERVDEYRLSDLWPDADLG